MIDPEMEKQPASKADILRLEEKLDNAFLIIRWAITGAYAGLLAVFAALGAK